MGTLRYSKWALVGQGDATGRVAAACLSVAAIAVTVHLRCVHDSLATVVEDLGGVGKGDGPRDGVVQEVAAGVGR